MATHAVIQTQSHLYPNGQICSVAVFFIAQEPAGKLNIVTESNARMFYSLSDSAGNNFCASGSSSKSNQSESYVFGNRAIKAQDPGSTGHTLLIRAA
jgi:hypothetical protein